MMRRIKACYGHHAVNVADSYCPGTSNRRRSSQDRKINQNSISNVYKAKLSSGKTIVVMLTWYRWMNTQGFQINFSNEDSTCFSESLIFGKRTGSRSSKFLECKIDCSWDISSAKFGSGPEPVSGFYLLVAADSENVLLIGDREEVVGKKGCTCRMIQRIERFSGTTVCTAKARFCGSGMEHEIEIECLDGVLSVRVDERRVVRVEKLRWNFRGNQTMFLDGVVVDVLWDLHGWFFESLTGFAVFMFRTRTGSDWRLWLDQGVRKGEEEEKMEFSLTLYASKLSPS